LVSHAYQVSQHFFPKSTQPFLVMTDGAFVALVFVVSNLVDWLVSLTSPLAYLPPLFTQNSGWQPSWRFIDNRDVQLRQQGTDAHNHCDYVARSGMICRELINTSLSEVRIDFDRYTYLHPEGRRLISGWFERAWAMRDCQGEDCFEAFIFAWIAFNGWAACITERDEDYQYLDALKRDQKLYQDFKRLVAIPESPLAFHAVQFAAQWPIFEVKSLRRRNIIVAHEPGRRTVIKRLC
jgi:hypothetical protein